MWSSRSKAANCSSLDELDNFKRINPEGYELMEPEISKKGVQGIKLSVMKWGSNDKKINAYICPKIWCVVAVK